MSFTLFKKAVVSDFTSLENNTTPSTSGGEAFLYKHSSNGAVVSGPTCSIETGASGSRSVKLSVAADGAVTLNNFTLPTAIGSSGQILKVPSSGSVLEWGDESGGGGGGIDGSGTAKFLPLFSDADTLTDSGFRQDPSNASRYALNSPATYSGFGTFTVHGSLAVNDSGGAVYLRGSVMGTTIKISSNLQAFVIRDNDIGKDIYEAKGRASTGSYHKWKIYDSQRMELTYEGILELNGANTNNDGDAYSQISNTKSLTLANDATTSFPCAGAMFAIYDTSSTVGGLFFSHYSASSVEKIAGSTHFSTSSSSGSIRITTAANDHTVIITNKIGQNTTIKVLVIESSN